ncbi:hypothetical protein Q3G72_012554 [Acer saccharum]|nr:hypothetical protein Q3G72_012554 [Acer saccharum]
MTSLSQLWLHGNLFTGPIPDLSGLGSLEDLSFRDNQLTGIVPLSLVNLPKLGKVNLTNNLLQGPTPKFDNSKVVVDMNNGSNSFCLDDLGLACDDRITVCCRLLNLWVTLKFLQRVGKEMILVIIPLHLGWGSNVTKESQNVTVITYGNPHIQTFNGSSPPLGKPPGSSTETRTPPGPSDVVRLTLDIGQRSIETRVAGTFGYLAPDDKNTFSLSIDEAIEVDEGKLDSISTVVELAMHCCVREPYQKPEMAHVVNVLSSLADKWAPTEPDFDHDILGMEAGIDPFLMLTPKSFSSKAKSLSVSPSCPSL